MKIPCSELHSWVDVTGTARNWRNNYGGTPAEMTCCADTMRALAEQTNRILGRYPQPTFMMGWPAVVGDPDPSTSAETAGSDPFINWAHQDYTPNARSGEVRIVSAYRSDNTQTNSFAWMSHNGMEQTALHQSWAEALHTNYFIDAFYETIEVSRGNATNTQRNRGLSTYGGYQVLDIVEQDSVLLALDSNAAIHESVYPNQAKQGHEVLSDIAAATRSGVHSARKYNHGVQATWAGYGTGDAWTYPAATDQHAMVCRSTATVNLINQAWTVTNANSPGVTCKTLYCGRGHLSIPSGTVAPVNCHFLVEANTATAHNGCCINVRSSMGDYTVINIPSNIGAASGLGWVYGVVGVNTMWDPTNTAGSEPKVDLMSCVPNAATDTVYVRSILIASEYN